MLRFVLKVIGKNHVLGFVKGARKDAGSKSSFSPLLAQMHGGTRSWCIQKAPRDTGKKLGDFCAVCRGGKMMERRVHCAPKHASVLIYPYGGATYRAAPQIEFTNCDGHAAHGVGRGRRRLNPERVMPVTVKVIGAR